LLLPFSRNWKKAEIETFIDEQITKEDGTTTICEGTTPYKFPLEEEQRFRFTLPVPGWKLKSGRIFLFSAYLLKIPIGKNRKRPWDETDYRYDGLLRAET